MTELLTVDEITEELGITAPTNAQKNTLGQLLEAAIADFEGETNRERLPFQDKEAGRVETLDGTGRRRLWLQYPIGAVTTIKLGRDQANPVDTLDPADVDVVVFALGSRKIERTDGGTFGPRGSPRYVHVTYDAAADLPADVRRAIKVRVLSDWQRKGLEGIRRVSELGASVEYVQPSSGAAGAAPPTPWAAAVARHYRPGIASTV